jgi:hypothetical protein
MKRSSETAGVEIDAPHHYNPWSSIDTYRYRIKLIDTFRYRTIQ